ncbi:MAG: hypothetical protein E6G94_09855 [Alphaproteobacteria bacterium]|nr:MAG: hypothetical protein E6G94_09855 [Alphaproteobacteria bacterium]
MDPISQADRLVLILRQRLAERARSGRTEGKASARRRPQSRVDPLRALAAVDDGDERQLRRLLVQTLLADQLGQQLVNEPQFQQVVDRVTEAIEGDGEAARLLARVAGDLRKGG